MEHLSLLAGGQEHSSAEWEKAAADVLRKAGRMTADDPDALVWEKLARTTLDGVRIAPLGTPETVAGLPSTAEPGTAPYVRGSALSRPDEGWDIRTHVGDPDPSLAAAAALDDLENGATSLWLRLGRGGLAADDLPRVLEKVHVDLAPVVLDCPADQVGAAEAFCGLLADRDDAPAPGTSLGGDPIGARLRGHAPAVPLEEAVARLVELAQQHAVVALTVDATFVNDAGGTDAQELGYSMAVGAAYLRLLVGSGLDVATAASLVDFRHAVTDEQLTSIAKLRAARRLWHRVLELSGAPDAPGQVQHAVTSRAMMTKYDPWVNMLRGTVAAFAAGVGGASSVTVLPFDTAIGLPDAFSRRIARNTSSLLIHESHVARVTDPAGGSYAIERLTHDLAEAGWAELQRIEAEGGAPELGRPFLDRLRNEGREPRSEQVATRKRAVTGVTEYPNLDEELPERRPFPEGATELAVNRYGVQFEALRDDPAATPVFVATMGSVAQHTARATFVHNLLAAGGVAAVDAGPTSNPDEVLAAYTGHPVVTLAGPDKAYEQWGSELVAALRSAGARHVILAGNPGPTTVPAESVDDSCALGIDALAFLHRVREELAR
ncbi:MAG TPA: methylmalonyl-CoA mutase family protein [Marmoricola sp.]|nr:methylmalonyl-CoA mutase family protein [Marmoricola sp.]